MKFIEFSYFIKVYERGESSFEINSVAFEKPPVFNFPFHYVQSEWIKLILLTLLKTSALMNEKPLLGLHLFKAQIRGK